ncbi:MAG: hypothetical protein QOH65_1567 [Methylobacteriaceae bacterium]|jgi:hypothetical protein|nr:hypothetical protein [Methylobacteriaceae bacterium]
MALSQISAHKPAGRNRDTFTFALVALAVAFAIIGNITAAGPAVYRAHSVIAAAR